MQIKKVFLAPPTPLMHSIHKVTISPFSNHEHNVYVHISVKERAILLFQAEADPDVRQRAAVFLPLARYGSVKHSPIRAMKRLPVVRQLGVSTQDYLAML